MKEKKDKSLDDLIKEAELAKLKAETAEVEKRSKQIRVMGVPIVQIIFGGIVVGFILLNYIQPLVNLNTDKANLQTDISSKEKDYNEIKDRLERIEIEARGKKLELFADSLKIEQARLDALNDSLKKETIALKKQSLKAQLQLENVDVQLALLDKKQQLLEEIIALKDSSVFDYRAEYDRIRSLWEKSVQKLEETAISLWKAKDSGVRISGAFANLDSLTYADLYEKYHMIADKSYYDRRLNPEGEGINNKFDPHIGHTFILDEATRLYWQKGGSGRMNFAGAKKYILKINTENYGGHSDWRLPILKEAMSLMQPKKRDGFYIDEVFDRTLTSIWTADKHTTSHIWVVNFEEGFCSISPEVEVKQYVRAVRSDTLNVYK